MIHTNITTWPFGSPSYLVGAPSSNRSLPTAEEAAVRRELQEVGIDEALAESFPASDPPAWNLTTARLVSRAPSAGGADAAPRAAPMSPGLPGIIDVSAPGRPRRTAIHALTSFVGAAGLALLVPVAILVLGLPIALAGKGVLAALAWLLN